MLRNLYSLVFSAAALTSAYPQSFNTALTAAQSLTSLQNAALIDINALSTKFQNNPWIKTQFITCTMPSKMDDTQAYFFPMVCTLAAKPKSDVTVFLETFGAKFDVCFMTFPAATWNVPVTVNVVPSLNLFPTTAPIALTIYAVPAADLTDFSNQVNYWTVAMTNRAPVTCLIWGDPHFNTFDMQATSNDQENAVGFTATMTQAAGPTFPYQGRGDYIIVQSDAGLLILGTYQACGAPSCMTAVSVQYKLATYLVLLNDVTNPGTVLSNDVYTFVITTSGNTAGSSYTTPTSTTAQIYLDDGSSVSMSMISGTISLVTILAPIHYQKVRGQCNFWDANITPLTLVARSPVPNAINDNTDATIKPWGDSWMIAATDPMNSLHNVNTHYTTGLYGQASTFPATTSYCVIPGMAGLNAAALADVASIASVASVASVASAASAASVFAVSATSESILLASQTSESILLASETSESILLASQTALGIQISQSAQSVLLASQTSESILLASQTSESIFLASQTSESILLASETSESILLASETSEAIYLASQASYLSQIGQNVYSKPAYVPPPAPTTTTTSSSTSAPAAASTSITTSVTYSQVYTPNTPTTSAPFAAVTSTCVMLVSDAQAYCNTAIQLVPGCESLCSLQTYLNTCVSDVIVSCGFAFVPVHRSAYLQVCSAKAAVLQYHADPVYCALSVQIQANIGINGAITTCPTGYGGTKCDVDMYSMYPGSANGSTSGNSTGSGTASTGSSGAGSGSSTGSSSASSATTTTTTAAASTSKGASAGTPVLQNTSIQSSSSRSTVSMSVGVVFFGFFSSLLL